MFESFGNEDPEQRGKAMKEMAQAIGPAAVTQGIHQAISMCWMILPEEKKNVAAVEAEIRRVLDRELKALREDAKAFGIPEGEQ